MVTVNKPRLLPVTQKDIAQTRLGGTGPSRKGAQVGAKPWPRRPGVRDTRTEPGEGLQSSGRGNSSRENQESASQRSRRSPDVQVAPCSRAGEGAGWGSGPHARQDHLVLALSWMGAGVFPDEECEQWLRRERNTVSGTRALEGLQKGLFPW